jgi:methyltransferase (TIGR00027 family)
VVESENTEKDMADITRWFVGLVGPGSKTAMGVLLARFAESRKPEGERICYDPYAMYFVSEDFWKYAIENPEKVKEAAEQRERFLPGMDNSIRARARYFDDFLRKSIEEGLEQLVILGAGYDTRDCRIEGASRLRTFEVDHPVIQSIKKEKIEKILGSLPDHVVYVPMDLVKDDLGQKLLEMGYNPSKRALFFMEGIIYYLPLKTVDEILSFIVRNSAKGSRILFDYYPQSVVDGDCELEAGRNLSGHLAQLGEPLLFGIEDGAVEAFLEERGFAKVKNVTGDDYKKAYFKGINEGRAVFSLLCFAHAEIE